MTTTPPRPAIEGIRPIIHGWTASDLTEAAHIGTLEVEATNEDGHPYTYDFEIIATHATSTTPDRLAFGGITNSGFLESGFIEIEDGETLNNTLNELHDDLQVYYVDGARFTNRIIANNRM